jgi:hypothetical protein
MVKINRPIYKPKARQAKQYLSLLKNNYLKGKYTQTENVYLLSLINLFKDNLLDIEYNYPLRIFLADCLGRTPMSISKRFTHVNKIGKQKYRLFKNKNLNNFNKKCIKRFLLKQSRYFKELSEKESEFVISKIFCPKPLSEHIFNKSELNVEPIPVSVLYKFEPLFSDKELSSLNENI